MKNTIEVEQKFRVENHDLHLQKLPSPLQCGMPILEVDIYYQHPSKNYLETGECLKIRNWQDITYKGPKLDSNHKVRNQYTWTLESPELFLETLGFTKLIEVHKRRIYGKYTCCKDDHTFKIAIALDQIKDLGSFIEIEIITEKENMDSAIQRIEKIANEMGLENKEVKGYAQLMLEKKYHEN
jgi:adenylate cyclase class 2